MAARQREIWFLQKCVEMGSQATVATVNEDTFEEVAKECWVNDKHRGNKREIWREEENEEHPRTE